MLYSSNCSKVLQNARYLTFWNGVVLVLFAPKDEGAKFLGNVSSYLTPCKNLEDLNLHWRFFSLTVPSLVVSSPYKFTLKCRGYVIGVFVLVTFRNTVHVKCFKMLVGRNWTLKLLISHLCLNLLPLFLMMSIRNYL